MKAAEDLRETIHAALSGRERRRISDDKLTSAAILLPLFRKEDEYHVLLTKRTETVRTHKGEISFPGGVYDHQDRTLEKTALRESCEEIGLKGKDVEILGCLDDIETLTNYMIRPFVGIFPYPYPFVVNREEIEEIIELPLQPLLQEDRVERQTVCSGSGERDVYTCRYEKHLIWGATAAILKQFLDLITSSP